MVLKNGESVETSNILYESDYFEQAQPSFTRLLTVLNTYYTDQWGLNNTGQQGGTTGIDINAPEAWELTEGSNNIVIAVLDNGVDLDHDDLEGNLLAGYDATDGSDGEVNGNCHGNYAHGTCCAGIIAAIDNSYGIKGVASNCKIVPVRIMKTNSTSDDDPLIIGMNYAWETAEADVISCSWGGRGSSINNLDDEISYALELGRDSLGCVVVFAGGNDNLNSIHYPANSNSDIIAVGAMSPCGERKSPSSCDTEDEWGSNYGTPLDVVAPGVLIPTTDIEGSAGYNTNLFLHTEVGGSLISNDYNNYDYTVCFNGTSAATPHVAGVAALILSINPYLTQDQVRDIIKSTARKVRTDLYTYSTTTGRTNGTWNNQMGYGLVDAYAAVIAAAGGPISGPIQVCTSGSTFSISPLASFDSIHWDKGACLNISSGQGTTSCTFVANCYASSYVSVTVYANGHGTTLPQKTVYAALAAPPLFDVSGPASIVLNNTEHFVVDILQRDISTYGIYYYDWSVTSKLQFESSHAYQTDAYVKGISLGFGTISFYTTNGCGTSTFNLLVRVVSGRSLNIYPNPASNEIMIEIDDEANFEDTSSNLLITENLSDTEYLVTVYNNSGIPVFVNKYLNVNEIKINTSSWQKGMYYVVLMLNGGNYSGSFIIE